MANRRMLSKDTFEDLEFEKLSRIAQYTYFVATLYADDEGYIKLSELKFRSGCTKSETDELQNGNFLEFGGEVVRLKNWEREQTIKKDRFRESFLKQGFKPVEPKWSQSGAKVETQSRVDKSRVDKNIYTPSSSKLGIDEKYKFYVDMINQIGSRAFKYSDNKAKNQFKARIMEGYTGEDFKKAIIAAYSDEYHKETRFKYLTPEFLTRSDKLEKYRELGEGADISNKLKDKDYLLNNYDKIMKGEK